MDTEDILIIGLIAAVAVLFMTRTQTSSAVPVIQIQPIPGTPVSATPNLVCPAGQVAMDVGDLAPDWVCGTRGASWFHA